MEKKQLKKVYLDEVDSTNKYISRNLSAHPLPCCVIANYQREGKGQGNNNWQSEKNKNLLFSYVFEPVKLKPQENFFISRIASLAIAEFLETVVPKISIKWPNDILSGNKKIAGILIENTFYGDKIKKSIIGAGINLNQDNFPAFHPGPQAGSLKTESGMEWEREDALDFVLERLRYWIVKLNRRDFTPIINVYNRKLFRFSKRAIFKAGDESFEAKILDVENDGHLLLETTRGEVRRFAFKEVSFVIS